MATIRTSIQVRDGMTTGLRSMNRALNTVVSSFQSMEAASSNSIDQASLKAAKSELNKAEIAMNGVEKEIREASEQQQKFNSNVNRTTGGASKLLKVFRNVAIAVGGLTAGKKLIEMSDTYSGIQARLNLINDGQQSVDQLNNMIFESANRARGSYTDMADVIGKLGITASQAFGSNEEMLRFSELMTKSFKVAGASAQEQSAAMYQLTQAMASGRLQGDEFRSILENAPMLAQSIAKEMGVSLGVLKEMSSEGLITSDVIKNALFNSAQEINQQFEQMPMRFDEMITKMKNLLINKLQPAFGQLSTFLNSADGAQFISSITDGIAIMANNIAWATTNAIELYNTIRDNWSAIEPIVYGVVGAVAAYNLVVWGAAAAASAKGFAEMVHAKGLIAAASAQWGLNAALLANPYTWIIVAIGILIALFIRWANKVGGISVAMHIMKDKVLTAWENIDMGVNRAAANVLNYIGDLKVKGLNLLQDFVNGAINRINKFIEKVNKIPGVSIDLLGEATFAANAAVENEAKKQARNASVDAFEKEIMQDRIARKMELRAMRQNAAEDKDQVKKTEDYLSQITGNTAETAESAGAMKDTLDITEEDLKYLRDIAERDVIDRTVLRDVKVDFKNTFGDIRETADVDGIMDAMSEKILEKLLANGEGVS